MIDPLYVFVALGLFTPGPNVILLTASGARFGLRASVPHILGVAAGVGIIAGLTGFGIGAVLASLPMVEWVLSVLAAGWIGWMAWTLWQARPATPAEAPGARPFTFLQAVLFQWVNPKLWAVALAAASGYAADLAPVAEAQRLAIAFSATNLAVCLFWTATGTGLARLLTTPRAWRGFTRTMALGLAASAVMVFW